MGWRPGLAAALIAFACACDDNAAPGLDAAAGVDDLADAVDGGAEPEADATPADHPGVNGDPSFLQVYDNNVENLERPTEAPCAGEWRDLIHYMKVTSPSPDLFLVQQLTDQAQLDFLVETMNHELPGTFAGIIALQDPKVMKSPCGPPKRKQTNGIIYRTGRLEPVGDKHVWQSWASIDDTCQRNYQARTRNVMQKFRDKVADKVVTVASIHWSTFQGSGVDPACARMNAVETDAKLHMAGFGGDLVIFGGDMNEPDRRATGGYRPWFARANGELDGDLGYRDPIFHACLDATNLQACLDANATAGAGRIDYLFAQRGDGRMAGTGRAHTIGYAEGDAATQELGRSGTGLHYSGHRAIRARVRY